MAEYKKQHYLPASYLRYFSEDQSYCRRDSFVWQFDGKHTRNVSVESQCSQKYFYSKKNAVDAEKMFQRREEIYCDFVDKIRAGQEPEIQNFGDLFLCMCDLHVRNAAHKNFTGQEGIDAYDGRLDLLFHGLLLVKEQGKQSLEYVKQHLQANWRIEIIPTPGDFQFITSDHPSVFMTCSNPPNPNNPLQIILLALDPSNIAVAFDRRFMSVEKKAASTDDVRLFNTGQVNNATRFVYSSAQFTGTDLTCFTNCFSQRKCPYSEITLKGWKLSLTYLPPQAHYSFIRMKSPQL